jgi:hypothetical protein
LCKPLLQQIQLTNNLPRDLLTDAADPARRKISSRTRADQPLIFSADKAALAALKVIASAGILRNE